MASFGKILTIGLMAACGLAGVYGSFGTALLHGFLDIIKACVADQSPETCALDMSHSPNASPKPYTGVPFIDGEIALLIEFFAQGVKGRVSGDNLDLGAVLGFTYMAAQFGGAWFLLALEGLRRGSQGSVLRRTGIFGLAFQAVTINLVAPVYLTIQLLLDPASANSGAILADPADLEVLPLATFISFVVPSIGLFLPLLNILDKEGNYAAIALWQPFPLYQAIVQPILRAINGGKTDGGKLDATRQRKALNKAYKSIAGLTMGAHLLVVGTIVASPYLDAVPTTSLSETLALTSLTDPPTLALLNPPVSALDSRTIVSSFLRWDVYGTCASLTFWAIYQWQAVQETSRLAVVVFRALFWAVLGGPLCPAIMLLWERDDVALDRVSRQKKSGKKNR